MTIELMAQLFKTVKKKAEEIINQDAHVDDGIKFKWPTNVEFISYEKKGYCPIRLVLKEGEALHIGRGR